MNGGLFSLLPVLATAWAGLYLIGCGNPRLTAQVYNDPPFNEKVSLSGLRSQAQAGSVVSMAHLGWRFDTGRGAEPDEVAAANWYREAADEGHSLAQNNLGRLYRDGRGVRKDPKIALKWFSASAKQGNDHARNNLGWMYERGLGATQDFREAA